MFCLRYGSRRRIEKKITAGILLVAVCAVSGYYLSYWLVIATSRLSGAKIVSLSVSEFFTYRISFSIMLIFCGLLSVAAAHLSGKNSAPGSGVKKYLPSFLIVTGSGAAGIFLRFLVLKKSAFAAPGEQAYLFLSSLCYSFWSIAAALTAFVCIVIFSAVSS
ncbi:MAG: hypothetical protein ACRCUT_11725, partial [Spirochaetota bacterium]